MHQRGTLDNVSDFVLGDQVLGYQLIGILRAELTGGIVHCVVHRAAVRGKPFIVAEKIPNGLQNANAVGRFAAVRLGIAGLRGGTGGGDSGLAAGGLRRRRL